MHLKHATSVSAIVSLMNSIETIITLLLWPAKELERSLYRIQSGMEPLANERQCDPFSNVSSSPETNVQAISEVQISCRPTTRATIDSLNHLLRSPHQTIERILSRSSVLVSAVQ